MLELSERNGRFSYPLWKHPISRVLKFHNVARYFEQIEKGGSVLDYGSGDRPYERMLLSQFDRYIAADHPEANAAHAKRPEIHIVDDKIELEDSAVDCVLLTEVLEHVFRPREALLEIHRVLRDGGHLVGSVPFSVGEHEVPFDFHRYTSFCLRKLFEETGFEVVEIEHVGDMVGVAAMNCSGVLLIVPKILYRLRLRRLAAISRFLLRAPEYAYWALTSIGIRPGSVDYYRRTPFGYTFIVTKKPTQTLPTGS